jgi:hypothetical protein
LVPLPSYHLRGCVARTSTSSLERISFFVGVREAKVNNLDVVVVIEKQVFWFKISVTNTDPVYVLDSGNDLLEELASLRLLKPLPLNDIVEEFSTICILHYKKELL